MTSQHFPYRLDKRWASLFLALGVGDDDGVDISDHGELIATFGRFSVADPEGLAAAIGK